MLSSNLNQISQLEQKNKLEIKRTIDKLAQTTIKDTSKQLQMAYNQAKREILSTFQDMTLSEFFYIFSSHYGKDYDRGKLQQSLSFSIDDNLRPKLIYNVIDFSTINSQRNFKKKFNKNYSNEFSRNLDFYKLEENDILEDLSFNMSSLEKDDYLDEAMLEELDDLQNSHTSPNVEIEAKELYKEAYALAMQKFLMYYNHGFKAKLEKKYGITLR